jgi:hypothetical protein
MSFKEQWFYAKRFLDLHRVPTAAFVVGLVIGLLF